MGRKRQVITDEDEDIISYEHNLIWEFVQVSLAIGSLVNGKFIVAENQNFEVLMISGDDYQSLLAAAPGKPAGVFRKEDLWTHIDSERSKVTAKRESIIESVMGSKK